MNARLSFSGPNYLSVCLVAAVLSIGCIKPTDSSAAVTAKVGSVTSNSFAAVTAQLDPGGSFYLYLGTEQWFRGLSSKVSEFRTLLTNLPSMGENELAGINKGFDVLTRLISSSGLEEVSGLGMSGIEREKDLYRSRIVLHHYPGNQKGFIWSLAGAKPHPLELVEVLPTSTALAISSDFNLSLLWEMLDREIKSLGITEVTQGVNQVREIVKAKYNTELEQIIGSAPGPFLAVLLLDETRIFAVPAGGASLKIPEPGLIILAKTKDETLYDLVAKSLPPDAPLVKTNRPGLKMQSMTLPMGLPFSPSVAQAGDYFLISSHPRHIEELLSVKQGTSSGLKSTPEFKRLSTGISLTGNQFSFVSERFGRAVQAAIAEAGRNAMTNDPGGPPVELMQKLMADQKFSFAVGSNTPEGWVMTVNGNQHPGALAAAPMLIAPVAILAGLALPALAKAKGKAQSISCVSNMKQICLAARIYSNDHNDTFPPNFIAMTNELVSPKILVCPQDTLHKKPESGDWALFDPSTISYEFVSPGTKEDMPDRVLIRCPIHGHVGLSDGSVQQRSTRPQ